MSSKIVLILGANGMLGKMMSLYFSSLNDYLTVLTSRGNSEFLINNFDDNIEFFNVVEDDFQALASKVKPDVIINCIGRIKPTINEEDNLSITETIKINSFFPMELQKYSKTNNIHYFQIGTDCVFSGKKGNYLEDDFLDADDLYGKSKIVGEIPAENKMIIRSSIIGPESGDGRSLLNWFIRNNSKEVSGFKNHLWNGVTTLNFSKVVEGIINNDNYNFNLQHLIPANSVNKAELLKQIKNNLKKK
jgi:dTDP-4-dehydrorhamnose reductase